MSLGASLNFERKIEQRFATFMSAPSFRDTGPPSAKKTPRPRRNSSEAKLSDWTADKPSLPPVLPKRKGFWPPFRDRFVGSLTVELRPLLTVIAAGNKQGVELATLIDTVRAMAKSRNKSSRRRRAKHGCNLNRY